MNPVHYFFLSMVVVGILFPSTQCYSLALFVFAASTLLLTTNAIKTFEINYEFNNVMEYVKGRQLLVKSQQLTLSAPAGARQVCRDWRQEPDDKAIGNILYGQECRDVTTCPPHVDSVPRQQKALKPLDAIEDGLKLARRHVGVVVDSAEMLERLEILIAGLLAKGFEITLIVLSASIGEAVEKHGIHDYLPCESLEKAKVFVDHPNIPKYAAWQECDSAELKKNPDERRWCRQKASLTRENVETVILLIGGLHQRLTSLVGSYDLLDWQIAAHVYDIPAFSFEETIDHMYPYRKYPWYDDRRYAAYRQEAAVLMKFNRIWERVTFNGPLRSLQNLTMARVWALDVLHGNVDTSLRGDWVPPCFPCSLDTPKTVQQLIATASRDRPERFTCPVSVVLLTLPEHDDDEFTRAKWRDLVLGLTMARNTLHDQPRYDDYEYDDDEASGGCHYFDRMVDFVVLVVQPKQRRQWPKFVTDYPLPNFIQLVPAPNNNIYEVMTATKYEFWVAPCKYDVELWEEVRLLTNFVGRQHCWAYKEPEKSTPSSIALHFLRFSLQFEDEEAMAVLAKPNTALQEVVRLFTIAVLLSLYTRQDATAEAIHSSLGVRDYPSYPFPILWSQLLGLAWFVFILCTAFVLGGVKNATWYKRYCAPRRDDQRDQQHQQHHQMQNDNSSTNKQMWRSVLCDEEFFLRLPEVEQAARLLVSEFRILWNESRDLLPDRLKVSSSSTSTDGTRATSTTTTTTNAAPTATRGTPAANEHSNVTATTTTNNGNNHNNSKGRHRRRQKKRH